jgi:uncharacterized membrane protein (UPF0136 family)
MPSALQHTLTRSPRQSLPAPLQDWTTETEHVSSNCSVRQKPHSFFRSYRELVRRELLRVFGKEAAIGLVNGIVLGLLLGGAALLWKGNPYLGLVVGVSLAANTLVAVSFGGLIPLILRGMKTDPALASGPMLTTITDMCGFFLVLSFASVLLPRLSGWLLPTLAKQEETPWLGSLSFAELTSCRTPFLLFAVAGLVIRWRILRRREKRIDNHFYATEKSPDRTSKFRKALKSELEIPDQEFFFW